MSKFCQNCGAAMEDSTLFCTNCGVKVANEVPSRKVNVKLLLIIAAAVVVVAVACFLLFGNSSKKSNYTTPINNIIAVQMEGDYDKIKELAPSEYFDYFNDSAFTEFKETCDRVRDGYVETFGEGFDVLYTVTEKEEISGDDLYDMGRYLENRYGIESSSVKAGYDLEVEFSFKGSKREDENSSELAVIQIDDTWYPIDYRERNDELRVYFFLED